ncbi:MAG: PAS domain S-box protein [Terracidiphilus sp.]
MLSPARKAALLGRPVEAAVVVAGGSNPLASTLPNAAIDQVSHRSNPASDLAQRAALANEERLRLAESAGHIGTWEWEPEQQTQVLSPELGRIFGIGVNDTDRTRKWAARVWPEDWAKVQCLMQQGAETGEMEFEYRYLHPDLGLRWLFCKGSRFHNEPRLFGIVQDVTARKAAEEASQRLVAIVESSDDAIVSKDLKGVVTSWNPGAERIFGFTAQEMIGRPITTIIPPELRDEETRILAAIARGDRIEHFETVRVKKNSDLVDVSLTVSPVKDEAGRIIGAAKIARDISLRKKAERTLLVNERLAAVGRLAATVAHEINNPLEAVTNLVYLAKAASPPGETFNFLTAAEEQLASVSHLTRQTLGFYRETGGARRMQPSQVVSSLLSVFAAKAQNKRIQLQQDINSDLEIDAVPDEIRQVVANLVSNSIDAVHGPGRIRIRISSSRHWANGMESGVRITVADTGSGIPPEIRPRVFEPFFTTKRDIGTGLGLWVCKSIVDNHHGTIRIRSSTMQGSSWTAVSIFLPLNQPEEAAA